MFCKYGDSENVCKDVAILNEIMARQGASLLVDVIAEHCGKVALKFSLNETDRHNLIQSLSTELREAIAERV